MNFLKKKSLWFTLYGILITLVFLYVLFPSDIAKARLEDAVSSSGLVLKAKSLNPSLPFGFKMKNVTVGSASGPGGFFQGDLADLQFNPVNFFQKNKNIRLSGKAYGGSFSGRFKLASFSRIYPPLEGKLNFEDIDLSRYTFIKAKLGKDITGKAKGSWTFVLRNAAGGNMSGALALVLSKGTFPLAEPFLGLDRFEFDRGEIKALMESGSIKLERLQVSGPQIDCVLSGEILPADDFRNSQLNLKGELIISGRKVKMNITIEGTLANPSLRYI